VFSIQDLGKAYPTSGGMKWALRKVSLSLPSVGLIAISGPSGSGKSTLLNLLSSLEKPSEGSIFYNGEDIASFKASRREDYRLKECAFVYQHFNLMEELSARENVALPLLIRGRPKSEAFARADRLLGQYGLGGLASRKAAFLSGGEKQRVALLRSLIAEPKVLFADEPTGALDRENEKKVMAELAALAKVSLVLLVTHNERLIARYAEASLVLEEGRLVSNTVKDPGAKPAPAEAFKRGPNQGWRVTLLWRNYRRNGLKNLLALAAGTIGYGALLLSLGYVAGSAAALAKERTRSLLYTQARISERKTFEIEGSPLSLTQEGRPSEAEARDFLEGLPNLALEADYSYFFPSFSSYTLNGFPKEPVSFAPISALTLSDRSTAFPVEGDLPTGETLDYCLVNGEFASQLQESPVGKTLQLSLSLSCSRSGATDVVELSYSFLVAAVVAEFPFLNSPRVYYSHQALKEYLRNTPLPLISAKEASPASAASLVEEADGLSPYSSYGYVAYALNEKSALALEAFAQSLSAKEGTLSLTSASFAVNEAFSSLSSAFSLSLIPFMVIEILGVAFILGSLAYSSFLERRKEAAILEALGARKADRAFIYEGESVLTSLLSAGLALAFSFPLGKAFSSFLALETGIADLVSVPYASYLGTPLFPVVAITAFALFVSAFGGALPLEIASRASLVGELRDE
jgi:putative ABC transport system ATP-binding protein